MKKDKIYTCYGCPSYYVEQGQKHPYKHCGEDHWKCPHYLGDGLPLIFNKKMNSKTER